MNRVLLPTCNPLTLAPSYPIYPTHSFALFNRWESVLYEESVWPACSPNCSPPPSPIVSLSLTGERVCQTKRVLSTCNPLAMTHCAPSCAIGFSPSIATIGWRVYLEGRRSTVGGGGGLPYRIFYRPGTVQSGVCILTQLHLMKFIRGKTSCETQIANAFPTYLLKRYFSAWGKLFFGYARNRVLLSCALLFLCEISN